MQSIASLIEDDSLYFTASSELDMNPSKPKIKKTIKSLSEHGMSQNIALQQKFLSNFLY